MQFPIFLFTWLQDLILRFTKNTSASEGLRSPSRPMTWPHNSRSWICLCFARLRTEPTFNRHPNNNVNKRRHLWWSLEARPSSGTILTTYFESPPPTGTEIDEIDLAIEAISLRLLKNLFALLYLPCRSSAFMVLVSISRARNLNILGETNNNGALLPS